MNCQASFWNDCVDTDVRETPNQIITQVFGAVPQTFGRVVWDNGNFVKIRNSKPWVYTLPSYEKGEAPLNDGDHVLLLPQDQNGLCPKSWFTAVYDFLNHFRSNVTFYPQETSIYKNITLVGAPDVQPSIHSALETAWREVDGIFIERIYCRSGEELAQILQVRIEENVRFRGKDEGARTA